MDNKRTPKFKELVPRWYEQREKFKKKFWRGVIHLFAWIGIAVIYYAAFSFFFRHAAGVPDETLHAQSCARNTTR